MSFSINNKNPLKQMTGLDQTLVVKNTRRAAFYLQEVLFLSF